MKRQITVALYVRSGPAGQLAKEFQLSTLKERAYNLFSNPEIHIFADDDLDLHRGGQSDLLAKLKIGEFDALLMESLDRLEAVSSNLDDLVRFFAGLESHRTRLILLQEQFDSETNRAPFSSLVNIYENARKVLKREKVKTSLIAAAIAGKKIGRPKKRNDDEVLALRHEGYSIRAIANQLGLSRSSVEAVLRLQ